MDMAAGYKKAVREHLKNATVFFDRFHVQRLVSKALDKVRRAELSRKRGTPEGRLLFDTRFTLLKRPWKHTERDNARLADIERSNRTLFRSYLLYQEFADALDITTPWRAVRRLKNWLARASRCRIKPFVKAARSVREHLPGILAYLRRGRLTNARVEGINNRIRVLARRAYGFHSANALISMIFLCCGGVTLDPPLPGQGIHPPFV